MIKLKLTVLPVTASMENRRGQKYSVKVMLATIIGHYNIYFVLLPSSATCLSIPRNLFGGKEMEYSLDCLKYLDSKLEDLSASIG